MLILANILFCQLIFFSYGRLNNPICVVENAHTINVNGKMMLQHEIQNTFPAPL